ncbi:NAD(P)-dependent alcohol dehydrogenase [Glaciihabitans sp. dw_435]|uniref:NAD(P)-dependent alcohol dehydrogenase n=1 Tax=Glaciihabitans sp. dw_435 TaxID=2720081 RepID=UPI001BD3C044|nr:NAD(P)-dependent alcohol dehydrogenase [Glaciihabitans sp. dw_435]
MKALQYREVGGRPEYVDVPTPVPGPGQVLLRVAAAGACHSDEFIMGAPEGAFALPLILGHEVAGTVEALGEGTEGATVGDSYLVYGPWGCGHCYACSQGNENNCEKGINAPGIHHDGGMAEYMIVDDVRHLVPLGDLDPVKSASLTDAALTPYHAIKQSVAKLVPGTTAVVIGAGGLGHVAIQILKAMTSAQIIVLDLSESKRAQALTIGADHALASDDSAIEIIKGLTGGRGADVIFDFVGINPTLAMAAKIVAIAGEIAIVGVGGGALSAGYLTLPFDVSARVVNWGTRSELLEVVELARAGAIHIETERFALADGNKAYEALHNGTLAGRAVMVP